MLPTTSTISPSTAADISQTAAGAVFQGERLAPVVETIAVAPTILRRGASWFAALGRPNNTGTKIYCVSGHVNRPGVYEKPAAYNLKKLIMEDCGGIVGGRKVKARVPAHDAELGAAPGQYVMVRYGD